MDPGGNGIVNCFCNFPIHPWLPWCSRQAPEGKRWGSTAFQGRWVVRLSLSHVGRGRGFQQLVRMLLAFGRCFLRRTRPCPWQQAPSQGPAGGDFLLHQQPPMESPWKWQQRPSQDTPSFSSILASSCHESPSRCLQTLHLSQLLTHLCLRRPLASQNINRRGLHLRSPASLHALLRTVAQGGAQQSFVGLCSSWSFITFQTTISSHFQGALNPLIFYENS